METMCLQTGISPILPSISTPASVDTRAATNPSHVTAMNKKPLQKSVFSRFSFKYPLESLWPRHRETGNSRYSGLALDDVVLEENAEGGNDVVVVEEERNENWVMKILHVNSVWKREEGKESVIDEEKRDESNEDEKKVLCECDGCRVENYDEEKEEEEVQFDRDSFSTMLRRVSLAEARLYAQMSHLGNLAYSIPNIKPAKLLKHYGLRLVTSSIEKKELVTSSIEKKELVTSSIEKKELVTSSIEKKELVTSSIEKKELVTSSIEKKELAAATVECNSQVGTNEKEEKEEERKGQTDNGYRISASAAYHIAATAASYLHAQTRRVLPFKSLDAVDGEGSHEGSSESLDINTEMASLMATTDSVTAVVAAKEEVKQAVADDLNSTCSSPCEWFVCDDDQSGTRFFVIQGSETLASWQANLLFEPIQFEGLDVLVHRGIYEAAKGMYQQMLPEVHAHLKAHGSHATFRFTGHSLGGSLALLVNLMLLIRQEVSISSLLPVITFGSPSIMCGGDSLLNKLGLPRSHVQAITMHRDIVPRAFSCNYPNQVADLLKAVNRNFRNHPCLNSQKLLFAPMGELLILQPDKKFSPSHPLLPEGSGLYLLSCPLSESSNPDKLLRAAQLVFLNSPHPLEILSDRYAYGSGGTIQRDHDMNSYLKTVRTVIRQELSQIRKTRREHRRKVWWPLVLPRGIEASFVVGRSMVSVNLGHNQYPFSGMVQKGRESLKRFSRLVASQHMHLFVLLLFPARLLLLGTYNVINFR